MNTLNHVLSIAGSATKLSKLLGVTPQAVNQWVKKGQIPARRCFDIHKALDIPLDQLFGEHHAPEPKHTDA
ncbi:TPA: helix-turn-helix domain-containing protein [Morganella morganii]|nr:helix-turn-helix domain-containing protein [Morganella morganii]